MNGDDEKTIEEAIKEIDDQLRDAEQEEQREKGGTNGDMIPRDLDDDVA